MITVIIILILGSIVGGVLLTLGSVAVQYIIGGIIGMNYQKIGRDALEGARIVLECILTIIHAVASITVFAAAYGISKVSKTKDVEHTVEIGFFGHVYVLTVKT